MREKSLIKKNILQFLDYKGIKKATFYKETGITHGVIDQNNGMSEENLRRFLTKYPEVSTQWLIFGIGEMIKRPEKHEEISSVGDFAGIMYGGNLEPIGTQPSKDKETDMTEKEIIEMQKGYIDALKFKVDALAKENQALAEQIRSWRTHEDAIKNM